MFKAIARLRQRMVERRIELVLFYMRQEKTKHQELMTQLCVELESLEERHDRLLASQAQEITP